MFGTAAGRKPHVRKEMTAVSTASKEASKGKPLARVSRPASSSPVYSPFETVNMPQTPAVPAAELSARLQQSVAAEGVLARDEAGSQQELDEEREVEALASPLKPSHEETLSETSQASLTVRQASEVPAEPTGREFLAAMTAFFSQMQAKQDEMNKFLVNKQEDMMDVLRHDVAKPLARLAERENSRSRSSSRASMASRGRVRNDNYTPLRCCMPPRFESKGKEPVYSRTREYDDAQLDEEQQHDSVSPVTQDESVLDAIDAKLAAMAGPQELEVLVALKRNEILRGITKGLLNFERFRRDRYESDSRYNE